MNSISFRHDHIIKTAVAKQKFIQDLIQKYGEGVIRPDFGLVNRYYEMAGLKSVDTMSAEYVEMINSLSESWADVKSLMEKEVLSRSSDSVKTELTGLGLKEEDITNREVRAWLEDRYIKNKGMEIHPIEESLPTLKEYVSSKDAILNKIKIDDGLKKELVSKGFNEDRLTNTLSLSIDDMVVILGQYKYGGETKIRTVGVEIRPEERVGKVGEWNIWLPQTQETSAKIAGYDDITKDPKTTWCTGRTKGSNLFYHYISREDIISFLFYIIKDNPSEVDDWLSIGFFGNKGEDLNEIIPVYGQNGGMTVNRDNKGLNEDDFKRILGNDWPTIFSLIKNKIFELGGENPATKEVEKFSKDLSLFKKEFWNKSEEERKDFVDIVLKFNPSNDIINFIGSQNLIPLTFIENNKNFNWSERTIDAAIARDAKEKPASLIHDFKNKDWARPYILKHSERLIEEVPLLMSAFFPADIPKEHLVKLIDILLKEKGKHNQRNINNEFVRLLELRGDEVPGEYILKILNSILDENIYLSHSLSKIAEKEWMKPYLDFVIKEHIQKEKYNAQTLLFELKKHDWGKPYINIVANKAIEEDPDIFLNEFSKEDWAKPYVAMIKKNRPGFFKRLFRLSKALDSMGLKKEANYILNLK